MITNLNLVAIQANDFNKPRSMDETEIEMLKDSIKTIGLINPVTVYYDINDGFYRILSGHKRVEACRRLNMESIPCITVEPPKNEIKEKELMLQTNMHRSKKEDLINEVAIAEAVWERMPKELQEKYRATFLKEFKQKNPDKPESDFRPKNEYVMHMTGLDCSYRTVQGYIAEAKEIAEEEVAPKEKKPKKKKTRNFTACAKATVVEFEYLVSPEYEYDDMDDEKARKIIHCIEVLKTLLSDDEC